MTMSGKKYTWKFRQSPFTRTVPRYTTKTLHLTCNKFVPNVSLCSFPMGSCNGLSLQRFLSKTRHATGRSLKRQASGHGVRPTCSPHENKPTWYQVVHTVVNKRQARHFFPQKIRRSGPPNCRRSHAIFASQEGEEQNPASDESRKNCHSGRKCKGRLVFVRRHPQRAYIIPPGVVGATSTAARLGCDRGTLRQ